MATIPLQVASRSLDTGNVVQYPGGGEVGRALQGAGNELQGVADHFKAVQDQQAKFDAGVVDDELRARLAETENEAARNAPADGSGIHDSVYGQMDPATGRAVKPGAFDTLFDEYAQKVPESQRANFMASKEAMRLAGSNRLATVQYQSRQVYEQVQLTKSQDTLLNGILQSDPNDAKTFEAFKQNGLDRIASSGMSAIDKEKAAYNWNQSATKGLFQSMLEKDPAFAGKARAALGLAPAATPQTAGGAVNTVVDRIIGVESGGDPNAKNPKSSASGVGQFLDSTWVQTVRQHRPDIAAGKSAAQIIALKGDRSLGREMTTALTQDNAEYLGNRAIPTTPGNLYLAHFLGSAGAVNVLKADPNASIASVVGQDVVRANPFLAGKTVADTIAWSDKKMGSAVGTSQPDPRFANLSPEDRLALANKADVQYHQQQATEAATAKADYTAYKDRFELGIATNQIADPALILGDKTLNDGDKASLFRSWNEQSKGALQIAADLGALKDGTLTLDPYAAKDKTRADNLYSDAMKRIPPDQQAGVTSAMIQQTGVVPQPVINSMRAGLSSQNPGQVIAAAQTAQRIAAFDPAALGRRDGGSEVQKAADDFGFYVNKLNLTPEEAARRMIDNASPEKQRDRKVLEPAAKEFVKTLADVDLSAQFKDGGMFTGAPALGLDPMQEAGIKADFIAIAEDQFYSANGNADLAKNRALEQMKTLYGVSRLSGAATVVKYPPERYWPKEDSTGGPLGIGADSFSYVRTQLYVDVEKSDPNFQPGTMQLVTTPETEADVKAGRLPGYSVLWKDANGNLQTLPGKVWRPDVSHMLENQAANRAKAQAEATAAAREKDLRAISGQDRNFSMDNMLNGNTQIYTPEQRAKFLKDQAAQPKPTPGANIPTDIPDPNDPQTSFGSAM